MTFEIFRSLSVRGRLWYWRLRSANHEIIAQGEGYRNRADCLHAIELVRSTGPVTKLIENGRRVG